MSADFETPAVPGPRAPARRPRARSVRAPAALGWGVGAPRWRYAQAEIADRLAAGLDARGARRLRAAFRGSGVRTRGSVLPDFAPGDVVPRLFGPGRPPTTAERMRVFAAEAPALAAAASRSALAAAGTPPARVTHVLLATCTGFASPGPDRALVEDLGLDPRVRRVQIGYQGCSAGVVALRTAAEIVRGDATAVVLVVAVELCSLHFRDTFDDDDLRGHALFADGAGAAVVGAAPRSPGSPPGMVHLGSGASRLLPGTADQMTWEVEDSGFRMRLSRRVPDSLAAALPAFLRELDPGLEPGGTPLWAVHPGGPAVLDRVRDVAGVPEERLTASRRVLREHGNMSSATIFFVLREIARGSGTGEGVALAFGPGLTAEALRFRRPA